MFSQLASLVLPWQVRWLVLAVLVGIVFMSGQMRGERLAGEFHSNYVSAQATQTVKIAQAQTKVVIETETKYVDRIKTIYAKGETIEKRIPIYITSADDASCVINTGFVRVYNAAWTSEPAGSAGELDHQPSGLSLTTLAEADAHNAQSCLAWREQALGLRELYRRLQSVTNGVPD